MTISREKIAELRIKNNSAITDTDTDNTNVITIDDAIKKCHEYVKTNAGTSLRTEQDLVQKDYKYRTLIFDYVDRKAPKVQGFYGRPDNLKELKTALYNNIVGYGQLTDPLAPSDQPDSPGYGIDEIRINEKDNIWIEKHGKAEQATDIVLSDDEMEIVSSRLLEVSKKILAAGSPVQNARTKEGYRVNIVHGSVSFGGSNVAVIRKFKSQVMTATDLIQKHKTLSVNMFRMLKLIVDSDSSYVVIGATGSGKTITNGLILRNIKNNIRIFSVENPVELPLKKRHPATGRVMNDVVQYEAQAKSDNPDAKFTVEVAIETALRQSPHWLILGEARTPGEFVAALTSGQTGHCFATTYHAESAEDALKRYLTAYMKVSQEPANLAMANICSSLRFIISQQKLPDGTRRIVEITEVFPPENLDSTTPRVNNIYEFRTDDIVYDSTKPGEYVVKEMVGTHHRVGKLSEENQKRWMQHGVSKERFAFLTADVDKNEVERYDITDEDNIE